MSLRILPAYATDAIVGRRFTERSPTSGGMGKGDEVVLYAGSGGPEWLDDAAPTVYFRQ